MREPEVYPELANRTRSQFVDAYSSELIQKDTGDIAPVFESFQIKQNYRYGVGLDAVVDVPAINAKVIEAMIAKFRALGEVAWQSATPVDRAKLPSDIFTVLVKNAVKT